MLEKLIVFLIRLKLGVRKGQLFRFENQKTRDLYYFTGDTLLKIEYGKGSHKDRSSLKGSKVSLNWLLDKDCKAVPWEAKK